MITSSRSNLTVRRPILMNGILSCDISSSISRSETFKTAARSRLVSRCLIGLDSGDRAPGYCEGVFVFTPEKQPSCETKQPVAGGGHALTFQLPLSPGPGKMIQPRIADLVPMNLLSAQIGAGKCMDPWKHLILITCPRISKSAGSGGVCHFPTKLRRKI